MGYLDPTKDEEDDSDDAAEDAALQLFNFLSDEEIDTLWIEFRDSESGQALFEAWYIRNKKVEILKGWEIAKESCEPDDDDLDAPSFIQY